MLQPFLQEDWKLVFDLPAKLEKLELYYPRPLRLPSFSEKIQNFWGCNNVWYVQNTNL